jgi:hypothetical protein
MGTPIDEAVADSLDLLEYLGDDGQMFVTRHPDLLPAPFLPPAVPLVVTVQQESTSERWNCALVRQSLLWPA